jgi:putative ABC transport system permease protein
LLALFISVLSIVNTMTAAITERTREIGVKRALGASRWRIGRDILVESSVMGALGGIGGIMGGIVIVLAMNAAVVAATGTTALLVTGRLIAGAMVFAVVLGALGGMYPALHASRLEPATALAYE